MKRTTSFAILLLFLAPGLAAELAADLQGHWSGYSEQRGQRTTMALSLDSSGGTADWPALGYFRVSLLGVKAAGAEVRVGIPLPVGMVRLVGTRDGDRIAGRVERVGLVDGQWKTISDDGRFELRKGAEPQTGYDIRLVSIPNGKVTLAASIFVPRGGKKRPGVVYIAGSGDSTRGDGSFLADSLARAGIATLVYDKRGAGSSSGNWKSGGFDELAADAAAALRFLNALPGIDATKSGFVCHSEGCWVAPIAIRNGAPARFLVAQSAPAVSVTEEIIDDYRLRLRASGFGADEIREAIDLVRTDQGVSRGRAAWKDLERAIETYRKRAWFEALGYEPLKIDDPLRTFARRTLDYDPAADIDRIKVPSLWIYGSADTVIPLEASLAVVRRAKTDPRPQVKVLPRAGHAFTVESEALPRLVADYPAVVVEWIRETTGGS